MDIDDGRVAQELDSVAGRRDGSFSLTLYQQQCAAYRHDLQALYGLVERELGEKGIRLVMSLMSRAQSFSSIECKLFPEEGRAEASKAWRDAIAPFPHENDPMAISRVHGLMLTLATIFYKPAEKP